MYHISSVPKCDAAIQVPEIDAELRSDLESSIVAQLHVERRDCGLDVEAEIDGTASIDDEVESEQYEESSDSETEIELSTDDENGTSCFY